MAKILIVEDEKNISKLIQDTLSLANYETDCSFDGEEALEKIKKHKYDLILLDIMLPKLSGFEVVEKLNQIETPIIFLSAKNDIGTIVKGLKEYHFKNIKIDVQTRTVYKEGKIVYLAPKEYDLLILLVKNLNKVLTRNEILDKVWDINSDIETRTVDYHIQQLRKKLDLKDNIITINKIGYILK